MSGYTAASARSGAVSFGANPFLCNKSRLKSFRPSSRTGLKPPVLASRSIVSDYDYYLLANTSFGIEATALFLGCKASISQASYEDIRNGSEKNSWNFSWIYATLMTSKKSRVSAIFYKSFQGVRGNFFKSFPGLFLKHIIFAGVADNHIAARNPCCGLECAPEKAHGYEQYFVNQRRRCAE